MWFTENKVTKSSTRIDSVRLNDSTRRSRLGAQSNHDSESDPDRYKVILCIELLSTLTRMQFIPNFEKTGQGCLVHTQARWRTTRTNTDLEIGYLTTKADMTTHVCSLHWLSSSTFTVTPFFFLQLEIQVARISFKNPAVSFSQFQPHRQDSRCVGRICGCLRESIGFDGLCTFYIYLG